MLHMRITFKDGRIMNVDEGASFDCTGNDMHYVCFIDGKKTGPILARRGYVYFFMIDKTTNEIVLSDDASREEIDFVKDTLAHILDCKTSGPLCLFELVCGGISKVEFYKICEISEL